MSSKSVLFKTTSNIRFILFGNSYNNSYQKDIFNKFVYIYIITIWRTQKENLRVGELKFIFMRKLNDYRTFIKLMPNQKFGKLSSALSALDNDTLLDL